MTIEKETPGVWIVCCDSCGERKELDVDPDAPFQAAVDEVKELGYRIRNIGSVRYHNELDYSKRGNLKVDYWTHTCPDCVESDKPMSLEGVSSMTDLRIGVQESRPYRLGREAAESGAPRNSNPMMSQSGTERWYLGYDDVVQERAADRLGV